MPKLSAGILLYRRVADGAVEVLVAHPGGPLFARRETGVWSVPKGEYEPGEEPLAAATREFAEELGQVPPDGERIDLGEVRQASGKRVRVWAIEGDLDPASVLSNEVEMEWPPGSGNLQRWPEIDRAAWVTPETARELLNPAQAAFVDRLLDVFGSAPPRSDRVR